MKDLFSKHRVSLLIGLTITALFGALLWVKFHPLAALEDNLLDYRFKLRGKLTPPQEVAIAVIDEKSIERLGRWPWSRDKLAKLVDVLNKAGAAVIVFDIILSESEANDPLLGRAINEAGNVILPVAFDFEKKAAPLSPDYLTASSFHLVGNSEMFEKFAPLTAERVLVPVSTLADKAMVLGHINMIPDDDGTLRWEILVIGYDGFLYPAATLQAAAAFLGVPGEKVTLEATRGVKLGKRFLPTDRWGRMIVNYYGPSYTFPHLSIVDILDGKVNQKDLEGRVILVGATAIGIYDLRVTPLAAAMPGVEKHASVIASILENRFLKAAPPSVDLAVALGAGLIFSLIIVFLKVRQAALFTACYLLLILGGGYLLFRHWGLWVNLAVPALNGLSVFIATNVYSFIVEERNARRVKAMFSSYVTERVVNELIRNPSLAKLGGERREITVLFSDVRGFTSFSEKHPPEEVVAILNEYLGKMTEIVFRWEGTLDKFIGDAIMAFWGAPLPQDDHGIRGVKCALEMVDTLKKLQEEWRAQGKPVLDCGIGLNCGWVLVGNIGAEGKKMDYTIIGDEVNLGARLESLTRKYDAHILLSENLVTKIVPQVNSCEFGHVVITGLERVAVKGKEKPVTIYEIKSSEAGAPSVITPCSDETVVVLKEK